MDTLRAVDWLLWYKAFEPVLVSLVAAVVGGIAARYLNTARDTKRAEMLDRIADATLAAIRLNNPGNPLVEKLQLYEDALFSELLKNRATTNNAEVTRRAASAAIVRALGGEHAVKAAGK